MGTSRRNVLLIAISIGCLGFAGVITLRPRRDGLNSIPDGEMLWVKCTNENCGVEYQISKKTYFTHANEAVGSANPISLKPPPMVCEKCGQQSIYRAVKCPNCQKVFFYGMSLTDFPDRCPFCDYSQTEELRNSARGPE